MRPVTKKNIEWSEQAQDRWTLKSWIKILKIYEWEIKIENVRKMNWKSLRRNLVADCSGWVDEVSWEACSMYPRGYSSNSHIK